MESDKQIRVNIFMANLLWSTQHTKRQEKWERGVKRTLLKKALCYLAGSVDIIIWDEKDDDDDAITEVSASVVFLKVHFWFGKWRNGDFFSCCCGLVGGFQPVWSYHKNKCCNLKICILEECWPFFLVGYLSGLMLMLSLSVLDWAGILPILAYGGPIGIFTLAMKSSRVFWRKNEGDEACCCVWKMNADDERHDYCFDKVYGLYVALKNKRNTFGFDFTDRNYYWSHIKVIYLQLIYY